MYIKPFQYIAPSIRMIEYDNGKEISTRKVLFEKRTTWNNLVRCCKKEFLHQSIDVEAELRELMQYDTEFMYDNKEQMKW